jgi:hypothetical protein
MCTAIWHACMHDAKNMHVLDSWLDSDKPASTVQPCDSRRMGCGASHVPTAPTTSRARIHASCPLLHHRPATHRRHKMHIVGMFEAHGAAGPHLHACTCTPDATPAPTCTSLLTRKQHSNNTPTATDADTSKRRTSTCSETHSKREHARTHEASA